MENDRKAVAVQWPGHHALEEARAAVECRQEVTVALPAGMHYALYRQLHPEQVAGRTERVDVTGGIELLQAIAAVKGLEDLAQLGPGLERAGYRLRLTSPEPTLLLGPPAAAQ